MQNSLSKTDAIVDAEPRREGPLLRLARYGIYLSMVQAWVATMASLYLSEVLGYVPCELCWLQRIFMYPIALILTLGLFKQDERAADYALLLAIPGAMISIYHYLLQKTSLFGDGSSCAVGAAVPCSFDYLDWFGVITIPLLALIAFVVIIIGALASRWALRQDEEELA
jgi:disulfide bond formation protein DsbB